MNEKMECAAPDCNQTTIGDSSHCISCRDKYNPIYGKYKQLHRKVKYKLFTDIKLLTEYDLLALVSKIEQVYELRSTYRRLAFKPTYWDVGHDTVLSSLLSTLDNIRNELYERFNTPIIEPTDQIAEPEDEPIITGSIVFTTKQAILKKESEESWPHSDDILNNIRVNEQIQRNINWLTDRILPLYPSIDNIGLLAFNQYLVTQYVNNHRILQFMTLPTVLSGVTRYSYQYTSHADKEAILKIAYGNALQHKWLKQLIGDKTITRIRNSLINRRIYLRIYYTNSKSELTEIYMNIVDGKVVLQYTQDIDIDILSSLDKMQKDTKGAVSSNERSFVADTANYNKDREELFKNGPVSIKDILKMSKEEIRSIKSKVTPLRKFK